MANKNKVEVLIATIDDRIFAILNKIKTIRDVNFLIVHQCFDDTITLSASESISGYKNIRYFQQRKYGVAASRNLALDKAIGDILLFCDDDITFESGFLSTIEAAYNTYPNASAITFSVRELGKKSLTKAFKKYHFIHNKLSILKVGTIEITVKRKDLLADYHRFPENLGAGTQYPVCDEPVFLSRLMNSNLEVHYFPTCLLSHSLESSGAEIDTMGKLMSRMIAFRYIFGPLLGRFLFVVFCVKNFSKIQNFRWVYDSFRI
ncbi:glycosyltransferase family A protein [Vibrio sp. M260112]|uniref:glycosyltransferase family A protein n=1 Tax=Vibrio sp. M260112 TaxID=3020895 RepID=UPI002F3E78D4